MISYIVKRLLQALLVLLGVMTLVFFLLHLSGDPTQLLLPLDATAAERAAFRARMGFNDPLLLQYIRFAFDVISGNLGFSYRHGAPARLAAIVDWEMGTVGDPKLDLGWVVQGWPDNTDGPDSISMALALLGQAMPVYWLGLMLILLFSVTLQMLPSGGRGGWETLILPAATLAVFSMARIARLTRSGMLDVLGQDYIRTARAAGIPTRTVVFKFGLRNAAIPLITVIGLEFGVLLGGAVITETIFSWPGVGRLAVDSIFARDYPVVQAVVLVLASIFVLINITVDVLYTYMDPRIREGGGFK